MFNIKTLVLIRDILMYIGMFVGIFMIGYVRVSFSNRQKKSPNVALNYSEKELKLRKIAIIILVITVALALIPTRNIQ
ncbi:MAG: hypothetical protein II153_04780 [Erysipelotrichaceae bacterium]|nr:hypothetical protein [Erysipelotrichaceae bacterium]MBQ6216874.1 hypothetical protein [Erysipelotrichaceae bacterium]MBR6232517.1 hypothetical protein [Erysipelotrichaceae bacterium]